MYSLLIAGLSITTLAAAFGGHVGKAKNCLWSPLIREDQLTCAAPAPKRVAPKVIQVEPELWNEYDERYRPAADYKLSAPWKGPQHCFAQFCVFSNKEKGDGMALITTARNAYLADNYPMPSHASIEPTAFYEAEVPGKGTGIIANRTIRKGEIVMQRVPALLIQATPHLDMDPELREDLYNIAIDRLPEATRERFMRQMGSTVYNKVEKNSFRVFVDGDQKHSAHLGLFPEISKFNHDCRPNLYYRIQNLTHTTVAVRDIPAGEELTISYIYGQAVQSERQSQLSAWGFACSCTQCTLPPREAAASETRIRQIKALEDEIEAKMTARDNKDGEEVRAEMGGKLVEMYLEERLDAYLGPTYTRAALIYSMFGHEEKAREYAGEAVKALEREYGDAAADGESMRLLREDPMGHWSWGLKVVSGRGEGARNGSEGVGK